MLNHLLVFSSYLGSGGAEKHTVRLINSLDPSRFQVTIVTPNKKGTYEKELAPHVKLLRIGNALAFRISPTLARLTCILPLRKLVKKISPQLVITVADIHTLIYLKAVSGLTDAPKHIALVQNTISQSYGKKKTPTRRFIYSAIPVWYQKINKIIALSNGVAQDLISLAPSLKDKVTVIYNIGVDKALLENASPIPLPSEKPIIVACGRLVPQKGYPYLIEAFAQVVKTRAASLLILGDGELRGEIEELVEHHDLTECVTLLGFRDNPYAYMASADLFVLSSEYEGFGNVIVEAMACGAPVIATDCPYGPAEIIRSTYNGMLVPVRDATALASAITEVLRDRKLLTQLRKNGYERAKDFDASKISGQYEEVFQEILSS